jgi:putative hydrolase of the HAD superfamily
MIFDLDDTLVECSFYYIDAMKKFARVANKRTKLGTTFCRHMLSSVDGGMLALPGAFKRERFPMSFAATSVALDVIAGLEIDEQAADDAFDIGNSIFTAEYPLLSGVPTTLAILKSTGVKLILNTKGDREVQQRKVDINGLGQYFDKVYITLKKDAPHLGKILAYNNLEPPEAICVGDSMRDDVLTPNSVGCETIFVSEKDPAEWEPKWAYEAAIDGPIMPTYWVSSVSEILSLNIPELTKAPAMQ